MPGEKIRDGWMIDQVEMDRARQHRSAIYITNIDIMTDANQTKIMMVMFNPSTGGETQDSRGLLKADKTINTILKAVDHGWFNDGNEAVTGVYICNLFTFRTPKPSVLINEYNRLLAENNEEPEILGMLGHFAFYTERWKAIAMNECKYIIIGWGDCGGDLFQGHKNAVLDQLLQDGDISGKVRCVGNLTSKRKNPKHPLSWNWERPDDGLVEITIEAPEADGNENEDGDVYEHWE